jgi:uncharacterized membrane protein YhaH (DUF805 family)
MITNLQLQPGQGGPCVNHNCDLPPLASQQTPGMGTTLSNIINVVFILFVIVYLLAFISFYISLMIRRLHDLNKTGLLWLLSFIPFVGILFSFYLLFSPGGVGENKYGSQPFPKLSIKQEILRLS